MLRLAVAEDGVADPHQRTETETRTPVSPSAGATFPHFWNIVNKITAQRNKVSRIYERWCFCYNRNYFFICCSALVTLSSTARN